MDKIVCSHFDTIMKKKYCQSKTNTSKNDRLEDHFLDFIGSFIDWCRDLSLFMLFVESMSNWHNSISSWSNHYRSVFSRRWKTMSTILSIDSFSDMWKQRWYYYPSLFVNDELDFISINFLLFGFITFSHNYVISINQMVKLRVTRSLDRWLNEESLQYSLLWSFHSKIMILFDSVESTGLKRNFDNDQCV